MKNVEALKALYGAISGGSVAIVEDDNTIAEVVDHLAGLMADVMWNIEEKLTPFEITLTATSASSGTSDKTAAEIKQAYNDGRRIIVYLEFDGAIRGFTPIITSIDSEDGDISMEIIAVDNENNALTLAAMPWSSGDDNTWAVLNYTLTPVE